MITDEMLLPFVPWLCGGSFVAFVAWVAWALWDVRDRHPNSRLEAERQAEERAWEDAHPDWVQRKQAYLLAQGVPAEYITDPIVFTVHGHSYDEWPIVGGGSIISPWTYQDQDPRWKEPAHG